ncbi:hypothetical protein Tco_1132874 [Tanacetum coccineum]|uniref:Uncharacterized protein n=1 Tax=Tanacetum coccineum TaxID=301880 RepID=A0ABQ5JDA1_9ASTR
MQGFGHYAKESRKQKRVKELHISQGKMMMCKQSEQVFHCKQRQADWLEDTDEEFDDEKLEAHYSFMAKIQEVLMKNPVLLISHWNSYCFVHELKTEMHEDFEYVESLEKEIDELESEKADFSNIYDLLLEECVSKDVICSYLHSLSDLMLILEYNAYILHNVKLKTVVTVSQSTKVDSLPPYFMPHSTTQSIMESSRFLKTRLQLTSDLKLKMRHSMRMLAKDTRCKMAKTIKTMTKAQKYKIAKRDGNKPSTKYKEKDQDHMRVNDKRNLIDLMKESAKKKKDKGKAVMIEDESVQKKSKKQVQEERLGHEEAIRLQEQIDEEGKKGLQEILKLPNNCKKNMIKLERKKL